LNRGFDHGCKEKSEEESCEKEGQKEGQKEVVFKTISFLKGQHTRTVTTSARTEGFRL